MQVYPLCKEKNMNVKSMSYTGKVLWTVWELDVEDYEILFIFYHPTEWMNERNIKVDKISKSSTSSSHTVHKTLPVYDIDFIFIFFSLHKEGIPATWKFIDFRML